MTTDKPFNHLIYAPAFTLTLNRIAAHQYGCYTDSEREDGVKVISG